MTELKKGEFHPAASNAMAYIKAIPILDLMIWQESFASTAISGNRLAELCRETLRRILAQEPVSDRYLLGLAWIIKQGENNDK